MSIKIINENIINAKADVIINAANGVGWMGGNNPNLQGVSESLNLKTNGELEKEALLKARKYKKISSWIIGHTPGSFFTTHSYNLNCKKIIHAVTMRYPGGKSSYRIIRRNLINIFHYCDNRGYFEIALPFLGCGTGDLNKEKVFNIIREVYMRYPYFNITIFNFWDFCEDKKN